MFVPIVITIAVIATIIWILLGYPFEFALSIGISVLVISCPCALGLATPVSIMVGTGKAAENGILIKSAESLELAHSINAIVLDKTGTITVGKPQVNDIFVFNKMKEGELLKIVGAIESKSEHPIAKAILEKTKEVEVLEAQNFEAIEGKGIKASINNSTYFAGNESLMKENNIKLSESEGIYQKLYEQAKTVIFVSDDEKLLGIIAISDTVKQTSIEAINGFKDMKIETYMLTGDNKTSAQAIGKMVGIDNIISEVLPQEKESKVRSLQEQGKIVAMIGDRNKRFTSTFKSKRRNCNWCRNRYCNRISRYCSNKKQFDRCSILIKVK